MFNRHFGGHRHGRRFGPREDEEFERPFRRGGPFGGGPFGGHFGGPFDEDGGGRRRQRRGDIKYVLLELLAEQPRHGYDLIKALEERSGGFYRPSPGTVYPTLQLLEDEGHLSSSTVDGKRVYTITDSGRQLLEAHQQRQAGEGRSQHRHGFYGPAEGSAREELRHSVMALMASIMQAGRHGTPAQVQAVLQLLDTTRREIYAILAKADAE